MDEPQPPEIEEILAELNDDARGRIKEELLPGERLLWAARSHQDPFRPGSYVLTGFVMVALVTGSVASFRQVGIAERAGRSPDGLFALGAITGIAGVILGIGIVSSIKGAMNKRWTQSQHLYAITNRRVILRIPTFDRSGIEVRAVDLPSVGNIHRTEYPDGLGTLTFTLEGASPKVLDPEHGGSYDLAESYRMEKIPEIRRVELLLRQAVADRRDHREQAPPKDFA